MLFGRTQVDKGEQIEFLIHNHTLFKDDNALIYEFIEEALKSFSMALNIQPYKRKKDGLKAWIALMEQHAGLDKWVAEIKKRGNFFETENLRWKTIK